MGFILKQINWVYKMDLFLSRLWNWETNSAIMHGNPSSTLLRFFFSFFIFEFSFCHCFDEGMSKLLVCVVRRRNRLSITKKYYILTSQESLLNGKAFCTLQQKINFVYQLPWAIKKKKNYQEFTKKLSVLKRKNVNMSYSVTQIQLNTKSKDKNFN